MKISILFMIVLALAGCKSEESSSEKTSLEDEKNSLEKVEKDGRAAVDKVANMEIEKTIARIRKKNAHKIKGSCYNHARKSFPKEMSHFNNRQSCMGGGDIVSCDGLSILFEFGGYKTVKQEFVPKCDCDNKCAPKWWKCGEIKPSVDAPNMMCNFK